MNILHMISYWGKAQGGPVESLRILASAQAKISHNVRILHTGIGRDGELASFPKNVEVINTNSFGPMRYAPNLCKTAYSNGFRPDVIHSHGMWLDVNRQAARLSTKNRISHVISACGMLRKDALQISKWKKKILWIGFQKRALESADMIHAKSDAEASEIVKYVPGAKVEIIPNSIEFPPMDTTENNVEKISFNEKHLFNRAGIDPGTKVLLFMGRVHPVKGLERLIEAWFDVYKIFQDWRLVIVGPDQNGYRSIIKSMLNYQAKNRQITEIDKGKTQTGVYFLDGIFGEERWQAYAAADLFIAPSDFENFGQSIAEAVYTGVPVITTTGTPWKQLKEIGCGWWVDPSPSAIASALREAMRLSDSERKAKGQMGRGLVQGFRPEKVAEDMCLLYESILSKDQRI